MKITDEFTSLMSYLTLLDEMSNEGFDTGDFPLNNSEIDFLDAVIVEITNSVRDEDQVEHFSKYIKSSIQMLFPIVFEQYKNEIEEHNLPLNKSLN